MYGKIHQNTMGKVYSHVAGYCYVQKASEYDQIDHRISNLHNASVCVSSTDDYIHVTALL